MMPNTNLPAGRLQFRKLSDEKLERIHAASLEILECTGLRLYEKQALELLKSKGVTVFPSSVTELVSLATGVTVLSAVMTAS